MRIYGDIITNETIVSKMLKKLNKVKNDKRVVTAILESKDLATYTFDELMSFLMAHEERVYKSDEEVEEKAFQVQEKFENSCGQGRGRSGGRGQGWGHGHGREESGGCGQFKGQSSSMSSIQCYYCKRYGHKEDKCWEEMNK